MIDRHQYSHLETRTTDDGHTDPRLPESEDPLDRTADVTFAHGDLLPIQQLARMDEDMLRSTANSLPTRLAAKRWQARTDPSVGDNPWETGSKAVREFVKALEMKHWIRRQEPGTSDAYAKKLVSRTIDALQNLTNHRLAIRRRQERKNGLEYTERRLCLPTDAEIPVRSQPARRQLVSTGRPDHRVTKRSRASTFQENPPIPRQRGCPTGSTICGSLRRSVRRRFSLEIGAENLVGTHSDRVCKVERSDRSEDGQPLAEDEENGSTERNSLTGCLYRRRFGNEDTDIRIITLDKNLPVNRRVSLTDFTVRDNEVCRSILCKEIRNVIHPAVPEQLCRFLCQLYAVFRSHPRLGWIPERNPFERLLIRLSELCSTPSGHRDKQHNTPNSDGPRPSHDNT